MNPTVWGPNLWFSLHTITLNYPKNPTYENKKAYNTFFLNLGDVLPCEKCTKHYNEHLIKYPLSENLNSRKELVLWLINIHNEVNKTLGKPVMEPSVALQKISNRYKNKNTIDTLLEYINWKTILITIVSIGVLFIIWKKTKHRNIFKRGFNIFNCNINNSHRNLPTGIYYGNRF